MEIFDDKLRALRRGRALCQGPELFLYDRAFEDLIERLEIVRRSFDQALLIGTLNAEWRTQLSGRVQSIDVIGIDELPGLEPAGYDLCVAVEGLDTVNDLQRALLTIRFALRFDSLFIGAFPGGDSLPALRAAMRAADEQMGAAAPRVHPRIEPAAFAGLLADAGFAMPVVDVDRVEVGYRSFAGLVRDLRSMGASNALLARSRRPLSRRAVAAAAAAFEAQAVDGRTRERFDILHFAAWTPPG